MANAKEPITRTFLKEGEITIDNQDTGGLTYLGLAHNAWPRADVWPKIFEICLKYLNEDGHNVTIRDLKNLGTSRGKNINVSERTKEKINWALAQTNTKNKIINFYKINFWNTLNADDICSQSFAESVFDFGINTGYRTSAKILQRLLKVTPDGIIGKITTYVLNCELIENHHEIHTQFALEKIKRYQAICINPRSKTKIKYLHGWLNRTFSTYEHNYTMDDLMKLIDSSTSNGLVGPRNNIKGYRSYMKNEEHFTALNKLIAIYKLNKKYSGKSISRETLLKKIGIEINK
jgi:hypothetical protein